LRNVLGLLEYAPLHAGYTPNLVVLRQKGVSGVAKILDLWGISLGLGEADARK